jgi:TrmH family RNA methyltransferase
VVEDLSYAVDEADYLVGTTGVDATDENLVRSTVTPQQMTQDIPDEATVGLLFGREGIGLTNDELARCDTVVRIPTAEDYPVMNLSHAVAVVFYECFTGRTGSRAANTGTPSSREERDVLENLFKDATERLDWRQHRQEKALRAFHNVIGRAYITGHELSLLHGAFREIRDRLDADAVSDTN